MEPWGPATQAPSVAKFALSESRVNQAGHLFSPSSALPQVSIANGCVRDGVANPCDTMR